MASRSRRSRPSTPWAALAGQASFLLDCQAVIMLRMMRLAAGGHAADREGRRMVTEKIGALTEAQIAATAAFPVSGPAGATVAAGRPFKRAVAANRRRLSR